MSTAPAQSRSLAGDPDRLLGELDSAAHAGEFRGLMTGIPALDQEAGAWQPGEVIVLAARPGVGKTSFAWQVAGNAARRNRPVLFASLEMTDTELVQRELARLAGLDTRTLRQAVPSRQAVAAMRDALADLDGLPLRIWSPPSATLAQIAGAARYHHSRAALRLLVVDYLQLVRPARDERSLRRHEQVAEVSKGLKTLAKELGIPILALCQLNREAESERPRLSMLRESGAIEQDADVVLFLHPQDEQGQPPRKVELIVAKHRHGATGSFSLSWNPQRQRFGEPAGV